MLKKLRLKFICITMAIVTIMLCVIFGLVYGSTSQKPSAVVHHHAAAAGGGPLPPRVS